MVALGDLPVITEDMKDQGPSTIQCVGAVCPALQGDSFHSVLKLRVGCGADQGQCAGVGELLW